MRRDLAVVYSRLIAETGTHADDGAELLIKNQWMEKIPKLGKRAFDSFDGLVFVVGCLDVLHEHDESGFIILRIHS